MSVDNDIKGFVKNEETLKKKNSAVPKPPKPGEVIVCQVCGEEMLPKDFSDDEYKKKKEFKWHMHWDCYQSKLNECDRKTPGLLSQRNKK